MKAKKGKKILIVEDELIFAYNLKIGLEKLGCVVTGVSAKGEEAVEMAVQPFAVNHIHQRVDHPGAMVASAAASCSRQITS